MFRTIRAKRLLWLAIVPVMLISILLLRDRPGQANSAGLSPLETRVFGQARWLSGGPAALRVIVSDHRTGAPLTARVRMTLSQLVQGKPSEKTHLLFAGSTNRQGTLDAAFTAPDTQPGAYQLMVQVESALGRDEIVQQIQLEEAAQVMLTSDKPLYQPGQTIHLRALVLDLATRQAVSGKPLTLEVEDARGNKVFKKNVALSSYGIAAADFTLAHEVNMGTFTLRAITEGGQAEKKVRVERYVLPKYKVALTTRNPYYLPGETVRGTVQADYFFGKPVSGGNVSITINTVDVGVRKLAELQGKTDARGTYQFEYTLPAAFYGQPFEQGKAVVEFHATVTDAADHQQEVHVSRPVVQDPILLVMVPERAQLLPGVKNRLYIAAATPDGTPLPSLDLGVSTPLTRTVTHCTTDALGLATYEFTPNGKPVTVTVRAQTQDGRRATAVRTFNATPDTSGIILRSAKTLARVGDRVELAAISSVKRGTIYLDVIRNRQTILTKALNADNGQAGITLPITDDMVGTLELHAYAILPDENIIRDTQVMIVSPADDLQIDVKADRDTYRPGTDALLNFTVRDAQRRPVAAALGLAVVDESVFALSELQPGLEKIYFTLERELLEPKYEIHGLTPQDILLRDPEPLREEVRQRAAAMLLAAAPPRGDFDLRVNTYQQRWEKMKAEVITEMQKAHQRLVAAVNKYRKETGKSLSAAESLFHLVDKGYLKIGDLKDRWGNFYRTSLHGQMTYDSWFTLNSAGPDGRWGTVDDLQEVLRPQNLFFNGRGDVLEGAMVMDALGGIAGPMAAPQVVMKGVMAESQVGAKPESAASAEPVRIRHYFPETMYWNPALITDDRGRATLTLPLADSITTWRMSMIANSAAGQLGSSTAPLRVFQDFFVDIDLPVALTQHDRIEVPVAVYNYLPTAQRVTLTLQEEPWFSLEGNYDQELEIGKDEVKVIYYPITVDEIGRQTLTITAKGSTLSDAIRREIEVLPDGKEIRAAVSDRLEGRVQRTVRIPVDAIDGASNLWVKIYPGAFSQVVEGLDGLLRMPNGCFEQTSSTTYPNVLVLDYLKSTKRVNPELQMKAEQYINVGYQRLVTFECKNGGFSWFGDEPAHQVLTAYGLLEFADMARVYEVDPRLITRTQQWLAGMQQGDGTWEEQNQGIAEGIINRQTGKLRTTAYIAWALAESGYQGAEVDKAVRYVTAHRQEASDPYTLAVILNLLTITDRNGDVTSAVARDLMGKAKTTDKTAYWVSDTPTVTGAKAEGADLETSGLATFGLVKWGREPGFTTKALTYLIQSKNSFGTWSSTQGTVWSLKSLLLASTASFGGGEGTVVVRANGQEMAVLEITRDDADVMRQVDVSDILREGDNAIELEYTGEGSLLYQVASRYYLPWHLAPTGQQQPPMQIDVAYDRTTLAQHDTAGVTVRVKNTAQPAATVEMPLIDIGLPPGFTPITDELDAAVANGIISKYTVAARQLIIYMEKLEPGREVTLRYQLKAKYPIKARTPQSVAYPYYNPEQAAVAPPQAIAVQR
jgi:uncharacterized protein YfaS (alpha-2-macroglobulin family)